MRRPILGLLLVAMLVFAVPAAGAMFPTFPTIEGTSVVVLNQDSLEGVAQPGTTHFTPYRGPIATREPMVYLPGERHPHMPDIRYDPELDGTRGLPRSVLAALSFNAMLTAVVQATPEDLGNIPVDGFDPDLPFRPDGCSFRNPGMCSTLAVYYPTGDVRDLPDVPDGEAAIPEPGAALLFGAGFVLVGARIARPRRR